MKLKKSEENKFLEIYLSVQENGKKIGDFFLLLEIMKKKNICKEKNEKKKMVQVWNGLLPNCILREWELYCNTGICIAVRNLGWAKIVLQYIGLYCSDGG